MPIIRKRVPDKKPWIDGQEAEVFLDRGYVIRVPKWAPGGSVARYFFHKIANCLMEPSEGRVLNIVAASAMNIRKIPGGHEIQDDMSVSKRVRHSPNYYAFVKAFYQSPQSFAGHPEVYRVIEATKPVIESMNAKGVYLSNHPANVDLVPGRPPFFYEVLHVNAVQARAAAEALQGPRRQRAIRYLDGLERARENERKRNIKAGRGDDDPYDFSDSVHGPM